MVLWERVKVDIILVFVGVFFYILWGQVFLGQVIPQIINSGFVGMTDAAASPVKAEALGVLNLITYGLLFLTIIPFIDMIISVFRVEQVEQYA